tara:strand:- start:2134 stop:3051 length:918 start_codon:yes stop_codon:yes gene_type:complete
MATRVYWAIQALGINSNGGDSTVGSAAFVSGVQSVGLTTTFNLEQVFQLGQLSLYHDVEEVPDIEVTVERVMDGQNLLYTRAFGEGTISANQNSRAGVFFNVYSEDNNEVGDAAPTAGVYCSGMYVSSASFTFPTDGNLTESITLVGNHAVWSSSGQLAGAPSDPQAGSVKRRQHVTNISTIQSNLASDIGASAKITNMTVSVDFGREQINILGQKLPYHRYVTYPVEVTCEVEVLAQGSANVTAYPEQDNVAARTLSIAAGGHTFNLGDANKLTTYTYGGGSTGGENATITYSYRNFNDLTVTS